MRVQVQKLGQLTITAMSELERFQSGIEPTMVFYDAEVAMILAVFFPIVAAQKHADGRLPEVRGRREDTWSPLNRLFRARLWKHTT